MCVERLTTSTAIPQNASHSDPRSREEPEHRAPDRLHIVVALEAKLRASMFGVGDTGGNGNGSGTAPLVEGR
jgi:hypothetical protein